jgi:hypothetical protein
MRMAVDVCRTEQMVTSLCQPLYSIILCLAMTVNGFSSGWMAGRGGKYKETPPFGCKVEARKMEMNSSGG